MIRLATPQDAPLVRQLASTAPINGARMMVDWQLLRQNPAMPYRFYVVGKCAIAEVNGPHATLCGPVKDTEQLGVFLRFLGVRTLAANGFAPTGWQVQCHTVMQRAACPSLPVQDDCVDPAPAAAEIIRLLQADKPMPPAAQDALYADICTRRNHGLAQIVGLRQGGRLVSTAGLYCITAWQATLAGVQTLPDMQGLGFARRVVRWLCAQQDTVPVLLLCQPHMCGFYEKLGFARLKARVTHSNAL